MWQELLVLLVTAFAKDIGTWAKWALGAASDLGEAISGYEWKRLVQSLVTTSIGTLISYFGLTMFTELADPELLSLIVGLILNPVLDGLYVRLKK